MTREEAQSFNEGKFYEISHEGVTELIEDVKENIDKIYDDFENNIEDECIVFSDERGYISEHGWAGKVKPNTKYKVFLVEEK